jgi:hypothetical protein
LNQKQFGQNYRSVSFESLDRTSLSPSQTLALTARAVHEVAIDVGRATISVCFSRASAAAAFAERFGDMLGNSAPSVVIYAVALDGEAYFWLSPDRVRRWSEDPSDELLVFFADNVALHEYLTTSADVGIHAAVISKGSHLVALVGESTAGKTTTALAAARIGFAVYSDERCILQDGHVVPFLRAITVREGGRSVILAAAASASALDARLRELPERGDSAIRPRSLLGERAGGPPQPLSAVFIIEGRAATPTVNPCPLYAGLPALLRSMISRERGIERAARVLAEFRDVAIYRLRLGTPHATACAIERALG